MKNGEVDGDVNVDDRVKEKTNVEETNDDDEDGKENKRG